MLHLHFGALHQEIALYLIFDVLNFSLQIQVILFLNDMPALNIFCEL